MSYGERFLLDDDGHPNYPALEEYVETLAEPQATVMGRAVGAERYFDRTATRARITHRIFTFVQVAAAAGVTVLSTASAVDAERKYAWMIVTAVLGALITIVRGIDGILPTRDTWFRLRTTQQELLSERIEYMSKTGVYAASKSPLVDYEARVKAIIGGELRAWNEFKKKGQGGGGQGGGSGSGVPREPAPDPNSSAQ